MTRGSQTEKKHWWKSAKIYELYIDKFAGTLAGVTDELDYFSTLGVNTLHLLPHYPSPMVDDGYDVTIDAIGVQEAALATLELARRGGKVLLYGLANSVIDHFPVGMVIFRNLT